MGLLDTACSIHQ